MLADNILSQLRALQCARPTPVPVGPAPAARPAPVAPRRAALRPLDETSQLPPGLEAANAWGRHWRRDIDLAALWPHAPQWLEQRTAGDPLSFDPTTVPGREVRWLYERWPHDVVLLDLETCGFAGAPIFLAGLLYQQDGRWNVAQLLARNYAEEKPLLQTLWTLVAAKQLLVTFNGKSFDWPMVHDRSTLHHLGQDPRQRAPDTVAAERPATAAGVLERTTPRPTLDHCDLLHLARRRWGKQLPDCRLQTLERHLCRRRRTDDIPGREIPAAYHDYVRHGDAWLLRSVLHHNALDLITLLQLALLVMHEKRL